MLTVVLSFDSSSVVSSTAWVPLYVLLSMCYLPLFSYTLYTELQNSYQDYQAVLDTLSLYGGWLLRSKLSWRTRDALKLNNSWELELVK